MEIRNGYFTPMDDEVNRLFTDIARKENQFAFELEFRADDPEASGPARMISLSDGTSDRNWTLGQQEDKLILRLRTTETGPNGLRRRQSLAPLRWERCIMWLFPINRES